MSTRIHIIRTDADRDDPAVKRARKDVAKALKLERRARRLEKEAGQHV